MNNELNFESNKPQVLFDNPTNDLQFQAPQNVVGGTTNYKDLSNKPKINGVELVGDIKSEDLGVSATIYFNTTYNELKYLQENAKLIAGNIYRITDYVTTSVQANTRSAGHQFDIIVTALDSQTLDEHAKAICHEGDTYFAESSLEGWQLWYTLDNDNTRFAWADENGKGVIYRLIDENGNDAPYDFKNIQMLDANNSADTTYYYTFDYKGTDYSLNGAICFDNVINKYVSGKQKINHIILKNYTTRQVYGNFFDFNCYNNTFNNYVTRQRFGAESYNNVFGGLNHMNTFDTKFRNNKVGEETQSITVGQGASNNTFSANIYYSTFGNYFRNNKVARHTYYSSFGHYVQNIIMGKSDSEMAQYMRYLTIENGVTYVNLYKTDATTEKYMENIKICSGTCGSSSNRINIEVEELAQKYAITYANNSKGELVKYCEADLIDIPTYEDGDEVIL